MCPLVGGVKAVAKEVEKNPCDLLGCQLDRFQTLGVVAFQGDVEVLVPGAGTVIGEVERLLDQVVEVDLTPFAADAARVLQHALDDVVSALAMLGDLLKVAR
jgi:hypothetical protein